MKGFKWLVKKFSLSGRQKGGEGHWKGCRINKFLSGKSLSFSGAYM